MRHRLARGSNITTPITSTSRCRNGSAFDFVRQQNKNRLSETALEYYGRKFTYADLIVNTKKTAAAFRGGRRPKG